MKPFQYYFKYEFLKRNNLPYETMNGDAFNKIWNGVLGDSNDLSLENIAPEKIQDALNRPDEYKLIYDEAYNKFAGVCNYIHDKADAKGFILEKIKNL